MVPSNRQISSLGHAVCSFPLVIILVAALTGLASGCKTVWRSGTRIAQTVTVYEKQRPFTNFSASVQRHFLFTYHPANVRTTPLIPVVFALHSQNNHAEYFAKNLSFDSLAAEQGFIVVYPQGLDDGPHGTGWNVGTHGDNSTCSMSPSTISHDDCYRSCATCGPCDWSTCHDDVQFMQTLIELLEEQMCADPQRLFVYGESNGGMLVHHLVTALPGYFLGAVPVIGLPLLGYLAGANYAMLRNRSVARTSIYALHDRNDSTIPMNGGDGFGWIYEPLHHVLGTHAALHACSSATAAVEPLVVNASLSCYRYLGCAQGIVAWCEYDGNHVRPARGAADLAWRFFKTLNGNAKNPSTVIAV